MLERKIIEELLNCVKMICISDDGSKIEKDILKSLRARARDLPSTLFLNGLAYTLVYIASRSNYRAIETGLSVKNCEDLRDYAVEYVKRLGKEEAGYALYGSLLAYTLKLSGLTSASNFDQFIEEALESRSLDQGSNIVAEWIKRLVEAYVEK